MPPATKKSIGLPEIDYADRTLEMDIRGWMHDYEAKESAAADYDDGATAVLDLTATQVRDLLGDGK